MAQFCTSANRASKLKHKTHTKTFWKWRSITLICLKFKTKVVEKQHVFQNRGTIYRSSIYRYTSMYIGHQFTTRRNVNILLHRNDFDWRLHLWTQIPTHTYMLYSKVMTHEKVFWISPPSKRVQRIWLIRKLTELNYVIRLVPCNIHLFIYIFF